MINYPLDGGLSRSPIVGADFLAGLKSSGIDIALVYRNVDNSVTFGCL